ncbi:hypothetical protein LNKW23_06700 [Paralimibaculum aggregatum]|uniref:Uncharacterized protein n=1 Tax=Paralimibaculum aggregatum TaxID=3036245 RepID=A0ABQ6LIH3_9RHOB|nr:hypothetical protein [Limibaculum sp. NKW23]GMG81457.1 hypothetical protein LNKW23_06700 [Limibaculum sp. NKW23]
MSFCKVQDLLGFARMAAARRCGVSLEDICPRFGTSHRAAQPMTGALDAAFANAATRTAEDRRRYWRLGTPPPGRPQPRQETTTEAPEITARTARAPARRRHACAREGAPHAARPRSRPTQVLVPRDDGRPTVRFTAAGWLEMARHLHRSADKVEGIAPERPRALVGGYPGPDIDALP